MSLGEILDRTFQIYRSRFFAMLGLAVLPLTVRMALLLVGLPFEGLVRQTTLPVTLQRDVIGSFDWLATRFSNYFLDFVMWPVFCAVAAEIALLQQFRIADTLKAFRNRWRGLLTIAAVFWLLENAIPSGLHGSRFLSGAWLSMPFWLGFIMAPVEAFALVAPLLLGLPIWTIEKRRVADSLARSWTLSKGAYGRMFVTCVLQSLIIWSITLSARIILSIAFNLIARDHISNVLRSSWIYLPSYLAAVIAAPVLPIAITLLYYDQRIRLEGFDIEWMMQQAGMVGVSAAEPALTTPHGLSVEALAAEDRVTSVAAEAPAVEVLNAIPIQIAAVTDNSEEPGRVSEDVRG